MTTELEVHRSKWALAKLSAGCSAVAAIFILMTFVDSLSPIFRTVVCFFGLGMVLLFVALLMSLKRGLPVCIVRDEGVLIPRCVFSRKLSLIPWTVVRDAALIDLSPASAPIGRDGAFGQPAIRLTLAERFLFSHYVQVMVEGTNHTPSEIYSFIRTRMAPAI